MSIGVALIGSGFMGRTWANVTNALPNATLRGVHGGSRASQLAADARCRHYEHLDDMLGDPSADLVIIASPPPFHAKAAVKAAEAGKSVFVEKPMANSIEECDEMVAACERAGVRLGVVSQHRFREGPRRAYDLVRSGGIGELSMIRVLGASTGWWDVSVTKDPWTLDPEQQGAYAGWGSHTCDLLRWFTGSDADLTFALFGHYQPEPPPDRSAMVTYRFVSGSMAQVWMTYDLPQPGLGSVMQFLIVGTEGLIRMDSYGLTEVARSGRWENVYEQARIDTTDPANPLRLRAYSAHLQDMVNAVAEGHAPQISGADGRAVVSMLVAAEKSARSGQSVSHR